jgi:putative membrane protein
VLLLLATIHFTVTAAGGKTTAFPVLWPVFIGLVILMWIIAYPIIHLWIKNLTYIIYDDRVTIHKGILTKTQQNIPFRAITDFALERSIFDRLLGIGAIKIQTAGQSKSPTGYEGKLSGLIDYDDLHTDLREKLHHLHPRSASLTTTEPEKGSDTDILMQILTELKGIRRNLDK